MGHDRGLGLRNYRSRGYPFDITSSTAIDQKFINGRNIYENISALVDELFTDYLRRQGYVEPLAAKFCNGVTTVSPWPIDANASLSSLMSVGNFDVTDTHGVPV